MAINVTPFVGTDNFNMATFNNMISQINSGVNNEIQTLASQLGVQIDSKAKIQTGSYVGTGTYGADNPCSLTFDFRPIVVYISPGGNNGMFLINIDNCVSYVGTSTHTIGYLVNGHCIFNENSVSWYSTDTESDTYGAKSQGNSEGNIYQYFAIG